MKVLDLFSGIGGFSLGLERAGMQTVAFCEAAPFQRKILLKHWPKVPCYDDIRTLTAQRLYSDGIKPQLICGGFPCQDISNAGLGEGIDGARSGLWAEYFRIICELRDCLVLVENVAALLGRGMGRVLGDLASIGYDAEWDCISARDAGADHERDRVWIVAYPSGERWQGLIQNGGLLGRAKKALSESRDNAFRNWRALLADQSVLRAVDGIPLGVHRARIHTIGNAVAPIIPEAIGREIMRATKESHQ